MKIKVSLVYLVKISIKHINLNIYQGYNDLVFENSILY